MKKLKLILPAAVNLSFKTKSGIIETNKKGEIEAEDEEVIAALLRSGFKLVDQHALDEEKRAEEEAEAKRIAEEADAREIAFAQEKAAKEKAAKEEKIRVAAEKKEEKIRVAAKKKEARAKSKK